MTARAEEYSERTLEAAGWPLHVASYRLGTEWHAKADNVSPGAALARATGESRQQAEDNVIRRATELLARTRLHSV